MVAMGFMREKICIMLVYLDMMLKAVLLWVLPVLGSQEVALQLANGVAQGVEHRHHPLKVVQGMTQCSTNAC